MANHVFVYQAAVYLSVMQHVRTRTHDAHVALQHVDKLRELIDVRLSHEVAEGKLSWVVLGSLRLVGILVHMHGTELQAVESITVQTRSCLLEEDRTRTLNLMMSAMIGINGNTQRHIIPLTTMSKARFTMRLEMLASGS